MTHTSKFLCACVLLATASTSTHAATVQKTWSFQDGTTNYDKLFAVAVDTAREAVYLTGHTWGDYGTWQFAKNDIMDYYSDFLAVKLNLATGKQIWAIQDQSGKPDVFSSAAIEPSSGDLIVTGTTENAYNCTGGCDWLKGSVVTKPDYVAGRLGAADGTAVWKWQEGTAGSEITGSGSVSPTTGDVVIVGKSAGPYARKREGDAGRDVRAYPYDFDFTIVRLDASGAKTFAWQDGTDRKDELIAAAHAKDGTLFVAGTTHGDYFKPNKGGSDIVVMKLDAAGKVLWTYQYGTAADDHVTGIAVDAKGDAILSGYVTNAAGNENFFAQKIKGATGAALWTWTDGTKRSDIASAITIGQDGTVVLAGYTSGFYGNKGTTTATAAATAAAAADAPATANAGLYDMVAIGLSGSEGKLLWSWQDGTPQSDRAHGIASAGPGKYVITGDTFGSYAATNKGGWDMVAALLTVTK